MFDRVLDLLLVEILFLFQILRKNGIEICILDSFTWYKSLKSVTIQKIANQEEAYSEPCETSKMESFAKIINAF